MLQLILLYRSLQYEAYPFVKHPMDSLSLWIPGVLTLSTINWVTWPGSDLVSRHIQGWPCCRPSPQMITSRDTTMGCITFWDVFLWRCLTRLMLSGGVQFQFLQVFLLLSGLYLELWGSKNSLSWKNVMAAMSIVYNYVEWYIILNVDRYVCNAVSIYVVNMLVNMFIQRWICLQPCCDQYSRNFQNQNMVLVTHPSLWLLALTIKPQCWWNPGLFIDQADGLWCFFLVHSSITNIKQSRVINREVTSRSCEILNRSSSRLSSCIQQDSLNQGSDVVKPRGEWPPFRKHAQCAGTQPSRRMGCCHPNPASDVFQKLGSRNCGDQRCDHIGLPSDSSLSLGANGRSINHPQLTGRTFGDLSQNIGSLIWL